MDVVGGPIFILGTLISFGQEILINHEFIFLITISLACLIFLIYPYFNNSKNKINDLQIYSEIERKKVLFELTSELENGTITQNQFNELKEELFKIESVIKISIKK